MLWRVAARIYTGASRRQLDGHGLLVQCLTLAYLLLLCLIPHIRFWVSYDVDILCTYNLQTKITKHILFFFNCFLIISFWDHIPGGCCNCPTPTGIKQLRLSCLLWPRPLSLLRPLQWLWLPRLHANCCPLLDPRPRLGQLPHPMQVMTLSVVSYTMTSTAMSAVIACWLQYLWWLWH